MEKSSKFRGGGWIGVWQLTWPFVTLEISQNQIILNNELFRKKYYFTRSEVEKIEIKKTLPIIGYGIRIIPRDKSAGNQYYFWYWSLKFSLLVSVLEELGWIN